MKYAWISALILAACAPGGPGVYRDAKAPFAYTTRFEWPRFEGRWFEVGVIGRSDAAGPQRQVKSYKTAGGTGYRLLTAASFDCAERNPRDPCGQAGFLATLATPVQGKAILQTSAPDAAKYFVLWTDESYRTAVLARHDGRFAIILDRAPLAAPDRYRAARTVLQFNGYDITALRDITP